MHQVGHQYVRRDHRDHPGPGLRGYRGLDLGGEVGGIDAPRPRPAPGLRTDCGSVAAGSIAASTSPATAMISAGVR